MSWWACCKVLAGAELAYLQLADATGDIMPQHDIDPSSQCGLALTAQHTYTM